MKIKIIDLLNKRANGEQLPLQIKYRTIIYNLMADNTYQSNVNNEFISFWGEDINYILNDEIEIIEEDKKIEKIDNRHYDETNKIYCGTKALGEQIFVDKINEIIDEVNKLKENK